MPEYRVTWLIDVEADHPRAAAEEAFAAMQDPDTLATCFNVEDAAGRNYEVDLKWEDQRARVTDVATGEVRYYQL
jgi:hypothetical protein